MEGVAVVEAAVVGWRVLTIEWFGEGGVWTLSIYANPRHFAAGSDIMPMGRHRACPIGETVK